MCYNAEPGALALDTFFLHLPVQDCRIFCFYTSNHLRKSWYTARIYSRAPNYHQLKKNIFNLYVFKEVIRSLYNETESRQGESFPLSEAIGSLIECLFSFLTLPCILLYWFSDQMLECICFHLFFSMAIYDIFHLQLFFA